MKPSALDTILVPGTDPDVVASYLALAERSEVESFGFEEEVCILDVETTGYERNRDVLIEVAAAIMRGPEVIDRYSSLIDPLVPIPVEISKLTGIVDADVSGAPCAEQVVAELAAFTGGRPIVAHNCGFDRAFLERAAGAGAFGTRWIDSLPLLRIGLPRLRSHRLQDLAAVFAPESAERSHRAAEDVAALCRLWRIALVAMSDLDPGILARIVALAPDVEWAERSVIAQVAGARPDARYDLREVRRTRVAADRADPLLDADEIECRAPAEEAVCGEFSKEGLAGRMYEGYEQRDEQVEMARRVLAAFSDPRHLAIEAGTGVGKSVAYLVPAALFARANQVGVGVATKTNALMDQLVYHELPRLNDALGGGLRYAALKGYDHYLCLRKLERLVLELDATADADKIGIVAMLLAWTSQSAWGDLDAVNIHWRRDVRSSIQAGQADCAFKRCRYYPNACYLHGVRRRAASAHVVVTNHALLFRDVVAQGGILPPIRHWIVDEAHAAESEARGQLTVGVSHAELLAALGALHGSRGSGLVDVLRRRLRSDETSAAGVLITLATMSEEIQRASTLAVSFFGFVKDLAPLADESEYDTAELWIDGRVRETGPWGVVDSTGRALARRLESVLRHAREVVTALEAWGPDYAESRSDLVAVVNRLAEQHVGLVAVVDGEDPDLVYSADLDRRPTNTVEKLVAERLDVGAVLAEDLYPRTHSVVFTSATIATGDSFDHFARTVGLDRLDEDSWDTARLASSYDFEKQMAVYVATDTSEPREARYMSDLERLLESVHLAMGGSVLTLFTNRRDMERLHAVLEPRLRERGLDVIVQRRGTSARRLREEFIADKHLSLFALKSFWEGFDAKGDTLRCVVVPKLPFGRPTDPLSRERELREGKAAWRRYALPEAILEMKQASGRLIRSSTDVGCLVIADARVIGRGYGRSFLNALPVSDIERCPTEEIARRVAERFGRP